jgi:regulatory protein
MLTAMADSSPPRQNPQAPPREKRRIPRPATPERLHKAALHYLERYASSTENLRRVLRRRIERSARLHGTDRAEAEGWIEPIVTRLTELGLLDDRAFAEGRVVSLHRRGASLRKIAGTLRTKGLDDDAIEGALRMLAEATPAADFAAAIRLARRRRLGPWRDPARRGDRRDRDLAALARAGFSYELASRVVDAESPEALDDALAEAAGR